MLTDEVIDWIAPCVCNVGVAPKQKAMLCSFIEFTGSDLGDFSELKAIALETARTVLDINEPDDAVLKRADGHEITLGAARKELMDLAEQMRKSWEDNPPSPGH